MPTEYTEHTEGSESHSPIGKIYFRVFRGPPGSMFDFVSFVYFVVSLRT